MVACGGALTRLPCVYSNSPRRPKLSVRAHPGGVIVATSDAWHGIATSPTASSLSSTSVSAGAVATPRAIALLLSTRLALLA